MRWRLASHLAGARMVVSLSRRAAELEAVVRRHSFLSNVGNGTAFNSVAPPAQPRTEGVMRTAWLALALASAIVAAACAEVSPYGDPLQPPPQVPSPNATVTARSPELSTPAPHISPGLTPPEVLVLLSWIDAFNHQDIGAFMSHLTETAVLDRGPHGVVTGSEAIRETLQAEFEEPATVYITSWSVEGNAVTYDSYVVAGGTRIDSCTSVLVLEGGRIASDKCVP